MILLGFVSTLFFMSAVCPPVARVITQGVILLLMGTAMALYFLAHTVDDVFNGAGLGFYVRTAAAWLIAQGKKLKRTQPPPFSSAPQTKPLSTELVRVTLADPEASTVDELQSYAHKVIDNGVVIFTHPDGVRAFEVTNGRYANAPVLQFSKNDIFDQDVGDLQHRLAANTERAYNVAIRCICPQVKGSFHVCFDDDMATFPAMDVRNEFIPERHLFEDEFWAIFTKNRADPAAPPPPPSSPTSPTENQGQRETSISPPPVSPAVSATEDDEELSIGAGRRATAIVIEDDLELSQHALH